MHKNIWVLTAAQALMMSLNSLTIFVGALVGTNLAPTPELATLPVATTVVGTTFSTVPLTLAMQKLGRKYTFLLVAVYSFFLCWITAYVIQLSNFYLFSLCTLLLGSNSATRMQYRFAAMESVAQQDGPKAASIVLIGGIASAFLGPEIAVQGRLLLDAEFAGSYAIISSLFLLGIVLLSFFKNTVPQHEQSITAGRGWRELLSQPVLWVAIFGAAIGYAIMTFIMTATPVSMHLVDGHSLDDTKKVIQSHIVAMYLPSLFTGLLIKKVGTKKLMISGLIIYSICISVAFHGHTFFHYWWALLLLGLGWNFLFLGGTALLPFAYAPSERFRIQGLNDFTVFGSQALASLSSGWIVHSFGWKWLLILSLPFILLQLFFILWWTKRTAN